MTVNDLYGIKIVKSDIVPPHKIAFIGKSEKMAEGTDDPVAKRFWSEGLQWVGMMDMETGEITTFEDAIISELRADEPTVKAFIKLLKK